MRARILAILLSVPACAAAQSLAGRWDAAMNTPGGEVDFGLILQVKGDTVTGTVKRAQGDVPLSGMVHGDSVWFSYTVLYNDNPFTLTMTARIAGDSLKGMVDFEGQASDLFWAHRAKPAAATGAGSGGLALVPDDRRHRGAVLARTRSTWAYVRTRAWIVTRPARAKMSVAATS